VHPDPESRETGSSPGIQQGEPGRTGKTLHECPCLLSIVSEIPIKIEVEPHSPADIHVGLTINPALTVSPADMRRSSSFLNRSDGMGTYRGCQKKSRLLIKPSGNWCTPSKCSYQSLFIKKTLLG